VMKPRVMKPRVMKPRVMKSPSQFDAIKLHPTQGMT
jgi:hypothetical protein